MLSRASRRFCALNAPKIRVPQTQIPCRSFFSDTCTRPSLRGNNKYDRPQATQIFISYPRTHARSLTHYQRLRLGLREASKGIWRKNPILLPLAIISLIGAGALFTYIVYVQTKVNQKYHNFPPKVEKALRTALYYTEIDLNPSKALKSYDEALRLALQEGMHPYSDEVFGIKLQASAMLEKAGLIKGAIRVLEKEKEKALAWIEEGRRQKDLNDRQAFMKEKIVVADPNAVDLLQAARAREEYEERQRNKTLRKVIGMQLQIAQLYKSEHMQDLKKAEEAQVAAIELCLKEMRRRQSRGLPVVVTSEDDDSWLTLTEVASAMNDLAETYFNQGKTKQALPVFMRAIAMIREAEGTTPTCKQVVLLSNIAASMYNHRRIRPLIGDTSDEAKQTVEQIGDATCEWAAKALEVAARIEPPIRDETCDSSCAAAAWYLGRIAQFRGRRDEAKARFLEAKQYASAVNFKEGLQRADEALAQLEEKK
ncbi:hypothetical protein VTN77DRAFT_3933 [Rasamsonia byssochlamydoides]|uniref:uncharacterized protein n=1 Tax=Rasamsonia byssochlamydoides TaxID=89139 RepID=UPI003743397E